MEQSKGLPKITNKGTSQQQRSFANLDPARTPVDNERLPDLLTFLFQFSRLINHFDDQQTTSNWSVFFEESIPFRVARIATFDTYYFYETYQEKERQFKIGDKAVYLKQLFILQFEMAIQIDKWRQVLTTGDELKSFEDEIVKEKEEAGELKTFIDNIIKTNLRNAVIGLFKLANAVTNVGLCSSLLKDIVKYRKYFLGAPQMRTWGFKIQELLLPDPFFLTLKASKQFKYTHARKSLENTFYFLNISIIRIPQSARTLFENSLHQSNVHEPHLSLVYAFFYIYKEAQGDLNQITQRHLDFFYKEVLNIKEKESLPDFAHVVFGLSSHIQQHLLEKNTQLVAGEDNNGTPILFRLEEEMLVTEAQVKSLSTLYLPRAPKYCPDQKNKKPACQYFTPFFSEVAFVPDAEGLSFAHLNPPGWPGLGASEYGSVGDKMMTPFPTAEIGLLLAGGNFNLKEGDRTITLNIKTQSEEELSFLDHLKRALITAYALDEAALAALEKCGVASADVPDELKKEHQIFWGDNASFLEAISVGNLTKGKENLFLKHAWRNNVFQVYYSTTEGWMPLKEVEVKAEEGPGENELVIQLKMHLDTTELPFVTNGTLYPYSFAKEQPLLKLIFSPSFEPQHPELFKNYNLYYYLRQLTVVDIETQVEVKGIRSMVVQNDDGLQDVNSSVLPFGVAPKKGADFYIGGTEVFFKNLKTLNVKLEWEDLPDNFTEHYRIYGEEVKTTDFNAAASILLEKEWQEIASVNLFEDEMSPSETTEEEETNAPLEKKKLSKTTTLSFTEEAFKPLYATHPESSDRLTVNTRNGYFRLRMGEQDFLNDLYAPAVIRQASAIAALANEKFLESAFYTKVGGGIPEVIIKDTFKKGEGFKVELPKEPYLPKLATISLDYTAIDKSYNIQLFHVYPHKGSFKAIDLKQETPALLPLFTYPNETTTAQDNASLAGQLDFEEEEGLLFIGLEKALPGSQLNLLFQVAASTGNPDLGRAKVKWAYLSDNEWRPLRKDFEILSDETKGLINSGVIQFALPLDIKDGNTCLDPTLYWIRASCTTKADAVSKTIAVYTQSAKAVFERQANNDLQRLGHSLPGGSISELQKVDSSIDQVLHPFDAFGGRTKESTAHFYTRVSEHLRHKGRAVTAFDYERMVLEAFPDLYLAKCINHTLGQGYCSKTYEMSPSYVTVAVIPDIAQQKNANRLTPKVSLSQLDKVEWFLRQRVSPFVRLQVLNPRYEPVRTAFGVRFKRGKSVAFYQDHLNERIKQFLSPWAYDDGHSITFGNVMEKSAIVEFIEKEHYVEYIKDFKFIRDEKSDSEIVDKAHLFAGQTPLSVLFSDKNVITPL